MTLRLSAVAVSLVLVGIAGGARATTITSPNTFRADFDFSGDPLLPLNRVDAYFTVDQLLDPLLAGENFTFSLFDDESTLLSSNTLSAPTAIGFFGRTFFLAPGELLDGIGFVTVTGNTGSFAISSAFLEGRQSPLPAFSTQNVSYSAYTPVPEPSTALLFAAGLLGLGLRR